MRALSFIGFHYLGVVLLAFIANLFGRRLTRQISYDSVVEEASFSVALGLGVIAYLVFSLGLLGLLYAPVLGGVLFAGTLICYREWVSLPRWLKAVWVDLVSRRKRSWFAVALILGLVSAPFLLLPLFPPTAFDSTMYHLASSKIYAESHRITVTPFLRYPVLPQTNQMLFTLALMLGNDILAQLIEFLMMATLVAGLVAFGRRFFSKRAGLWSGAILLQSPLVIAMGSVAYVEIGVALFVTMAVYAFYNWSQAQQKGWLLLSGVFCGLGVGTKYPALFFLVLLQIAAMYYCWRKRAYLEPFVFGLVALLVAVPWLLRNFYYTKNPLFPLFGELFGRYFGYTVWDPADYELLRGALSQQGLGKSFEALLLLPWNLITKPANFGGWLSPVCLLLPQALYILGVARRRVGWLVGLGTAYAMFWFLTVQGGRFLIPALPILSLASGAALDQLVARFLWLRSWSSSNAITILVALVLVAPGWTWSVLRLRERGAVPVTQHQRDDYLSRQLPSYPAYKFLNNAAGKDYKVFAPGDENMAYFAEGVLMGDHFGPTRYSGIERELSDVEALHNKLSDLGAQYFLVKGDSNVLQTEKFTARFKMVYSAQGVMLFQVVVR